MSEAPVFELNIKAKEKALARADRRTKLDAEQWQELMTIFKNKPEEMKWVNELFKHD